MDSGNKKQLLPLLFAGVVIAFLFARGFYLDKIYYKQHSYGVITNKEKKGKSLVITISSKNETDAKKFIYSVASPDGKKMLIGDSVSKNSNSYYGTFFSKANGSYIYKDLFEIYHW